MKSSRRGLPLGPVLVALLTVAACGGGGGSGESVTTETTLTTQRTTTSAEPASLLLSDVGPCTIGAGLAARCGRLQVPEDWDRPDGPQGSLEWAVLPARNGDPEADPLFYLAGFGSAATNDADWAATTFADLNETRDLVFVDQRGTHERSVPACDGLALGPEAPDPAAIQATVSSCLNVTGLDPRHLTTASAVLDLDRARKALGYDQVNLYGGSYGVSMGLAYLQRYADHVRSAVFDSGSLLDVRLWERGPLSAQQAFDEVARRCSQTPACAAAYRPAEDLAEVVADLSAHPAQLAVDTGNGRSQTVTITLEMFLGALIDTYLASPQGAALLPADLRLAAHGEWAQLADKRQASLGAGLAPEPVALQPLTLRCSDEWAAMDPARIGSQVATAFTPLFVHEAAWQAAVCASWPHDQGVSGAVTTSVPIVFLNGSADPADPPANVAAATETMPNALTVVVPGGGHGNLWDPCLRSQANQFIDGGRAPSEFAWTTCAHDFASALPDFEGA